MLCNRPVDDPTSKLTSSEDQPPFRSMVGAGQGEQLGLTPCKTYDQTVKKRGPSAALRRHVRWLRELQDQMREERDQVDQEDAQDGERKQKMKDFFEGQRDAVRQ